MLPKTILDLFRRDVLAAADDQVLDAAGDSEVAVGVDAGFVAGAKPAIRVDRRTRRLRVVVVALHHVISARAKLAALAGRADVPGFRIDDPGFDFGKKNTHRLRALLH